MHSLIDQNNQTKEKAKTVSLYYLPDKEKCLRIGWAHGKRSRGM